MVDRYQGVELVFPGMMQGCGKRVAGTPGQNAAGGIVRCLVPGVIGNQFQVFLDLIIEECFNSEQPAFPALQDLFSAFKINREEVRLLPLLDHEFIF